LHIQERTRRRWSLLELNEIIETAKKGLELGCTEALLVTGERPEAKYKEAINFLKNKNLISTIEWLYYVSKTLLELGIIPHTNAVNIKVHTTASTNQIEYVKNKLIEIVKLYLI
jgi:hypothetical protein